MLRLWLVRHGSTQWAEQRRYTGLTDIPLTELGRAQARALAFLADRVWTGVWSSDLRRAVETAQLAGLEPTLDERLREIDFGAVEGKHWEELDAATQQAITEFDTFAPPGGETVAQLNERLDDFVASLTPGDHVVFTHGGVIRALVRPSGTDVRPAPGSVLVLSVAGDGSRDVLETPAG